MHIFVILLKAVRLPMVLTKLCRTPHNQSAQSATYTNLVWKQKYLHGLSHDFICALVFGQRDSVDDQCKMGNILFFNDTNVSQNTWSFLLHGNERMRQFYFEIYAQWDLIVWSRRFDQ